LQVSGRIEIDNGEAQRAAALTGAGIMYAPRILVENDLRQGHLVEVGKGWKLLTLPIQYSVAFAPVCAATGQNADRQNRARTQSDAKKVANAV
jgi:DNA-binding transcriptional LysR family regulator